MQNPPVITGYRDCLRMVSEIGSPHLKVRFDARLEHGLDEVGVRKAVNEVGALQTPSAIGVMGDSNRAIRGRW